MTRVPEGATIGELPIPKNWDAASWMGEDWEPGDETTPPDPVEPENPDAGGDGDGTGDGDGEGELADSPWSSVVTHNAIDTWCGENDVITPSDWSTMTIAQKKAWLDENIEV